LVSVKKTGEKRFKKFYSLTSKGKDFVKGVLNEKNLKKKC